MIKNSHDKVAIILDNDGEFSSMSLSLFASQLQMKKTVYFASKPRSILEFLALIRTVSKRTMFILEMLVASRLVFTADLDFYLDFERVFISRASFCPSSGHKRACTRQVTESGGENSANVREMEMEAMIEISNEDCERKRQSPSHTSTSVEYRLEVDDYETLEERVDVLFPCLHQKGCIIIFLDVNEIMHGRFSICYVQGVAQEEVHRGRPCVLGEVLSKCCGFSNEACDAPFWRIPCHYFYGDYFNPCRTRKLGFYCCCKTLERVYPRPFYANNLTMTGKIPHSKSFLFHYDCSFKCAPKFTFVCESNVPVTLFCLGSAHDRKMTSHVLNGSDKPINNILFGLSKFTVLQKFESDLAPSYTLCRNCGPSVWIHRAFAVVLETIFDREFPQTKQTQKGSQRSTKRTGSGGSLLMSTIMTVLVVFLMTATIEGVVDGSLNTTQPQKLIPDYTVQQATQEHEQELAKDKEKDSKDSTLFSFHHDKSQSKNNPITKASMIENHDVPVVVSLADLGLETSVGQQKNTRQHIEAGNEIQASSFPVSHDEDVNCIQEMNTEEADSIEEFFEWDSDVIAPLGDKLTRRTNHKADEVDKSTNPADPETVNYPVVGSETIEHSLADNLCAVDTLQVPRLENGYTRSSEVSFSRVADVDFQNAVILHLQSSTIHEESEVYDGLAFDDKIASPEDTPHEHANSVTKRRLAVQDSPAEGGNELTDTEIKGMAESLFSEQRPGEFPVESTIVSLEDTPHQHAQSVTKQRLPVHDSPTADGIELIDTEIKGPAEGLFSEQRSEEFSFENQFVSLEDTPPEHANSVTKQRRSVQDSPTEDGNELIDMDIKGPAEDLFSDQRPEEFSVEHNTDLKEEAVSKVSLASFFESTSSNPSGKSFPYLLEEQLSLSSKTNMNIGTTEAQMKSPQYHGEPWGYFRPTRRVPNLDLLLLLYKDLVLDDEKAELSTTIQGMLENMDMDLMQKASHLLDVSELPDGTTSSEGTAGRRIKEDEAATAEDVEDLTLSTESDANFDFVEGLDDLDKFFEGVDPPDELDVGASGLSLQEVLVGKGRQILVKKMLQLTHALRTGWKRLIDSLGTLVVQILDERNVEEGQSERPSLHEMPSSAWNMGKKTVEKLVDLVDRFIDNFDHDESEETEFSPGF